MKELLLSPGQWKMINGVKVENCNNEMVRVRLDIPDPENYYCMGFTSAVLGGSYNPYGYGWPAGREWYKGYCRGRELIKLLGGE